MKSVLVGISLLISSSIFAGRINISLKQLSNVKINVDNQIKITDMEVSLLCRWKSVFLYLDDKFNKVSTDKIKVEIKKQKLISTYSDLSIDQNRMQKSYYCVAIFDIKVSSDSLIQYSDGRYSTKINLYNAKGDLTKYLERSLKKITFRAKTYTNDRGEHILARVTLD